jgi:hypothetical protein
MVQGQKKDRGAKIHSRHPAGEISEQRNGLQDRRVRAGEIMLGDEQRLEIVLIGDLGPL